MKQSISNVLDLEILFRSVKIMQAAHASGSTYYDFSIDAAGSVFGWHNPLFPPEYRRCCLDGKPFQATPSCDLYYFMADYYEQLTYHRAPHNFELNRSWKNLVTERSGIWTKTQTKSVVEMIAICTKWKSSQRIANADELLKMDFVITLI